MSSGKKKSRRKTRAEQFEPDDGHPESPESHVTYEPHPEPAKTRQARTMTEIMREKYRAAKAKREAELEAPP